jgi:hypothetical protein
MKISPIDSWYIIEAIESNYLIYTDVVKIADKNIMANTGITPDWICDLSLCGSNRDVVVCLYNAIAELLELPQRPDGLTQFHIGCIYKQFKLGRITFLEFVLKSGDYLDASDDWIDCSYFYDYANKIESGGNEDELVQKCESQFELKKLVNNVDEKFVELGLD